MTESEMIKRAKIYMEKLAMGINPLNDSPVPEGELINNVRLSRCFAFTAQMLERMTGSPKNSSKRRPPLSLDFEERYRFEYSDDPIPVSHIVKRLNNLLKEEKMLRFNTADITTWLMELDLLYSQPTKDGKYYRCPTPRGMEIGITLKIQSDSRGPYHVVVYNRNAQQFILDNLDAIINIRNMRSEKRKSPWSANEDDILKSMLSSGYPLFDITALLRRSRASVRKRIAELGLNDPATDAETE